MHFINRVRNSAEEMCSYLAKGKCNSFLPEEQPQNIFVCQKIILRIVYRIECVYLLLLECAQLSKTKNESWKFLAPSSNISFEFLSKPGKPSNFYFSMGSFQRHWLLTIQLTPFNPKTQSVSAIIVVECGRVFDDIKLRTQHFFFSILWRFVC